MNKNFCKMVVGIVEIAVVAYAAGYVAGKVMVKIYLSGEAKKA